MTYYKKAGQGGGGGGEISKEKNFTDFMVHMTTNL